MGKNNNLIFFLIVGIIILIAFLSYNQRKKLDWRETYTQEDKIPFGTHLLFQRLPDLFDQEIQINRRSFADLLPEIKDSIEQSSLIVINNNFHPDSVELNAFLDYIEAGNDVFMSVSNISNDFAKAFKIDIDQTYDAHFKTDSTKGQFQVNFYDPLIHQSEDYIYQLLGRKYYRYFLDDSIRIVESDEEEEDYYYYGELDSITQDSIDNLSEDDANAFWRTYDSDDSYIFHGLEAQHVKLWERDDVTLLGYDHESKVNFISISHGEGHLYFHTNPTCFTNYQLLNEPNHEYIASALSFLPKDQVVFWDENYKYWHRPSYSGGGRFGRNDGPVKSPFSYVMSQPALKWALMIFLVGLLLFMIFEAKRRQRIIPVINPPQNASLDFAETMGRLYYNNYDHKDIINKKIRYFLDYVRTKFYMKTIYYTPAFYQDLSRKSGVPQEKVSLLFKLIERLESHEGQIADSDLLRLNRQLELFYEQAEKR